MNETGLTAPDYSFNSQHTALIVGAGLAGCATAHALAKRGYQCKIYDQHTDIAKGASAIPAAIVRPTKSGDSRYADYFNEAFSYCIASTDDSVFNQTGVLQLIPSDYITSTNPLARSDVQHLDSKQASALADTELNSAALYFSTSGWLNPSTLCQQWAAHPNIEFRGNCPVTELRHTEFGWQLLTTQSKVVDESQLVIMASAHTTSQMLHKCHLPLQTVRGQIDQYELQNDAPTVRTVITGDGYLIPDTAGPTADERGTAKTGSSKQRLWVGATHQRNNTNTTIQQQDVTTNLATSKRLARQLSLSDYPTRSFAGIRTSTPDRLPLIGAMPDIDHYQKAYSELRHGRRHQSFAPPAYHQGLYITTGFGSRGVTQSAFSGELLASLITGESWRCDVLKSTHPARFFLRDLRRGVSL